MRVDSVTTPAAVGGAGAATATVTGGVSVGKLHAIGIQFSVAPVGNVTITLMHANGADEVIHNGVAGANSNYYPRRQATGTDGAAVAGTSVEYVVDGQVKVDLAASNSGMIVTTRLYVDTE